MSHPGQLVKTGKQLVQRHDQLLSRALRRQAGEALDVGKQNATGRVVVKDGGERGRQQRKAKRVKQLDQSIKYGGSYLLTFI